jgi:membrane protein
MKIRWSLNGVGPKKFALMLYEQIMNDDVFGYAAQLSYYFLFSLFPLLLCLTVLLGFFAETGSTLRTNLLNYLAQVMPESANELVVKTLDEISNSASGSKFSIGLLAALWTASSGMGAIISSLNVAYNVVDSRPWWRTRLVSIALTIVFGVMIVISAALIFYGGTIAEKVALGLGFNVIFTTVWKLLQLPLVFLFVLFSFSLVYHFGPDLKRHRWQLLTPGAVVALILWLIVSHGFRYYLHYFNSYSKTYGSLGAVIILLLWFYLTGAAILIGGEINSELEKIQSVPPAVAGGSEAN